MCEDENQRIELFDEFYQWLKEDGLKASKSERLHKKKVFSSLINNCPMTLDNFKDFLFDKIENQIKNLKFQTINYDSKNIFIDDVKVLSSKEEFILKNIQLNMCIKCNYSQIKQIKDLIVVDKF